MNTLVLSGFQRFTAFFLVGLVVGSASVLAQTGTAGFVRPGVSQTMSDLAFMKQKIQVGEAPIKAGWDLLNSSTANYYGSNRAYASLNWSPSPKATVERWGDWTKNIGVNEHRRDCRAAYAHAVCWYVTGDQRHADKAIQILNAWSSTLTSIGGDDVGLLAGLDVYHWVSAAEILVNTNSGWAAADVTRFRSWINTVYLPVISGFRQSNIGNWGAAAMGGVASIAIFNDDLALLESVMNAYLNSTVSGVTSYVIPSGQSQEANRDQTHPRMGTSLLTSTALAAWNQGFDLWAVANNRLAKGYEYAARYNLGFDDVPFVYIDAPWWKTYGNKISTTERALVKHCYERAYQHYRFTKGLALPNVEAMLAKSTQRPERGDNNDVDGWQQVWGTATEFRGVADLPRPLPSPWIASDVGAPSVTGSSSYQANAFSVLGYGEGFAGSSDQGRLVSRPLGNASSATVRLSAFQRKNFLTDVARNRAGLMLRSSLAPESVSAGVFLTPSGTVEFVTRASPGASPVITTAAYSGFAVSFQLRLEAGEVVALFSSDGTTWTQLGRRFVALGESPQVALAVAGGLTTTNNTDEPYAIFAGFRNFQLASSPLSLGSVSVNNAGGIAYLGDFNANAQSMLDVTVAAPGQVMTAGAVTLGGTLRVSISTGVSYAPGDQIVLLKAASITGAFSSVELPFGWSLTSSGTQLTLTALRHVPGVSMVGTDTTLSAMWGSPVLLAASATSPLGIAKVEFFDDAVKIGETAATSNGLYRFTWNGAAVGTRRVRARAYASNGAYADSQVITISISRLNTGTATWINTSGGEWGTAANWLAGTVPADTVDVNFTATEVIGSQPVTLDAPRSTTGLSFADTVTGTVGSWVINSGGAGTNALTLTGGAPVLDVAALGTGAFVEISAPLTTPSGFTKTGAGMLLLSGDGTNLTGPIAASGGTLAFSAARGTTRVISNPVALSGTGVIIDAYPGIGSSGTATILLAGGVTGTGTGTLWLQAQPNASLRLDSPVSHPAGELRLSTNGTAIVEVRNTMTVATLGVLNQSTGAATMRFGSGANVTATTQIAGRNGSRFLTFQVQPGALVSAPLYAAATNDSIQLDGGVLAVGQITFGGNGKLTGNGGELRAMTNQSVWITGTGGNNFLQAQQGGLRFNTNGYDVGLPQRILTNTNPDGGLTKLGAGTLTLSAAVASPNTTMTWRGPTVVSAGTLRFADGSGPSANSTSYTIAVGATLDVSALNAPTLTMPSGGSLTASGTIKGSLALNSTGTTTLAVGAPLVVSGTAALSGNLTITGTLASPGDYAVLTASSLNGTTFTGTVTLPAAPAGFSRSLVYETDRVLVRVTGPADTWLAANAPGQSLTADTDGDGWSLLQEYALGGSATAGDASRIQPVTNASGVLQLVFPYNTTATDVLIEVQASPNLVSWTPILTKAKGATTAWTGPAAFDRGPVSGGVETLTVTDPTVNAPLRFLRVHVTR